MASRHGVEPCSQDSGAGLDDVDLDSVLFFFCYCLGFDCHCRVAEPATPYNTTHEQHGAHDWRGIFIRFGKDKAGNDGQKHGEYDAEHGYLLKN